MQMIIQALLVTSLVTGRFSQKIVVDNSTLISPCTTGVRSAVDRYLMTGTIGDNITLALNQNWQTVMFIKMLRRTSQQYETICLLYMEIGTCQPVPTDNFTKCECFYNTTTDQANFTVSGAVQANDSNAIINVQWQHQKGTSIFSNTNFTFPEIYDVNAAHLNYTVAGVKEHLPSGLCNFSLTLHKSNDVTLCCSNTAKPCYPQISFNGTVVTSNTEPCVTYATSQLATDGVTGNLVLSYSVCDHTDYRQGSNCTVKPTPESPAHSDDNKCKTICPAVIVPVAVAIIGAGIAVYCYKTKKGSKAVSNGTNENADKAHTSERNKKDRQNPKYTNQAYDGRKSSPSEVTIHGVKTTANDNFQQHNPVQQKDSNKQINGRTNDISASETVLRSPRLLPPLKKTQTPGQLHPTTGESRPASIEITSTTAVKL